MSEEALSAMLSGSQGVEALDIARELVGCREQLVSLTQRFEELQARAIIANELAERKLLEATEAKVRLESICTSLANMSAECREYLGVPPN